jgi:hypothetical protein
LDDAHVAQVFAIAAIAALARHDGTERLPLIPASASGAAKFAHALGIDEVGGAADAEANHAAVAAVR